MSNIETRIARPSRCRPPNGPRLRSPLLITLPAALMALLLAVSAGAEPKEFSATYRGDFKGLPVTAKATRELVRMKDGSYLFTSEARSFLATVYETSRFRCEGDRIVPYEYQYRRKGLGRNRDEQVVFDWEAREARLETGRDPWAATLEQGILDRLSYQMQLRQALVNRDAAGDGAGNLSFRVADNGRIRDYRFEVLGEEWIETGMGPLRTVRVERLRNSDRRNTTLWLARDWDYLLVQLRQTEKGSGSFDLVLEQAVINGEEVTSPEGTLAED